MDFTSDLIASPVKRQSHSSDSSQDNNSGSSIILTETEKRRLELQELKETLLKERDSLWDEEVDLRRELDNLERDRFMQGFTSSESSDFESDSDKETEARQSKNDNERNVAGDITTNITENNTNNNNNIDTNAARMFLDLMLLSSKKQQTVEPRSKSIHINGNSTLQEEINVKYDTLPLLNMDLRLKYLQKYLYPHIEIRVNDLADENNNDDNNDKSPKYNNDNGEHNYEVAIKFKRNYKSPFQIRFGINYDPKDGSNGQLKEFQILEISKRVRLVFERVFFADRQLLIENPVTLIFFGLEFDRITYECNSLITQIRNKFQKKLRYTQDVGDPELKVIRLKELKEPSEKEFIIKLEIFTQKLVTEFKGKKNLMLVYPQLKITLSLLHEEKEIKDPNINNIFEQLLPDYELNTALIELISSLMFI